MLHHAVLEAVLKQGSAQLHSIRKKPTGQGLGLVGLRALNPWGIWGYWRRAGIVIIYLLSSSSFSPWPEGVCCESCSFVIVLLWKDSGGNSHVVNLTIFMTPVTCVKWLSLLNFLLSFHLIHGSKRAVPINRSFLPLLHEVLEGHKDGVLSQQ